MPGTVRTRHDPFAFFLYPDPPELFNDPVEKGHNVVNVKPAPISRDKAGAATFDDLLVAVGKTRNRDAFVRLFEHYAPRVKSFLMKGGLRPDQADEAAQETMLTVWQKAPDYDPLRAGAGTWIFTIARNKRIDLQRKGGRDMPLPEEMQLPSQIFSDTSIGEAQDARAVAAALDALPAEQSDMIRKAYFEDKTQNEIAAETGLPLGTVKSRIRLALEKLRAAMGDEVRP